MKITDKKLYNVQAGTKRITVKCGEGLFLRVLPSGKKSWVLRVYLLGTVRDLTIGYFPEIKLLQARQMAHLKREELNTSPSKGLTFLDAFNLWKRKKKGSIVSYEDEVARINMHLTPYLKNLPLSKITATVALNVLLKLDKKLPTLKRCLMRLNEILDLAVCSGLLDANPCRKLSKVFANHSPIHRPWIPAEELGELFSYLEGRPLWFHCLVIWAVFSGLRPVECVSVRREWFNNDTLTMPAEIMKKRRIHRIPIPEVIWVVLNTAINEKKSKRTHCIWTFGQKGKVINKQHISKWINSTPLKNRLCHHGLRSTFRTWLHDEGVDFEVAEDAIAHNTLNVTQRAYIRSDFLESRRPIMEKWAVFILKKYCANCAHDENAKALIKAIKPYLGND